MRIGKKWISLALALTLGTGLLAGCGDDTTEPRPLSAPTIESLARVGDTDAVTISWTAVAGAESYTVERRIETETGFQTLQSGVTETSYTDATVEAGTSYVYRVVAVRGTATATSGTQLITIGAKQAGLGGTIAGVRRLSADTTYILQGKVTVAEDGELHIPAGTRIKADAEVVPTFLVVNRGGKIFSMGTAEAPVVFTSSRPAGTRARGDWGGIVINGRSYCNLSPNGECVAEGGAGLFGGDDPDDDSGELHYTRIEYVGYEVSLDNELNGLTLNGVGAGTEIDHVQIHMGLDDGVELFGGTVNLKYVVVTGASDDSFDYSSGWQGKGQFWIAVQDPNDADTGFEIDNNETDNAATPLTSPTVYNVTLIGKGPSGGTAGESTRGVQYRRGAAGELANFIVMGFGTAGLDVDNTQTYTHCATGEFVLSGAIFHENAALVDPDADDEQLCLSQASWTDVRQGAPGIADPYVFPNVAVQPAAGSAAATGFRTAPADAFFSSVDYVGAVAPTGTPWYQGWITTATN